MPRFSETSCSQCGKDLGPGDCGVSSCADHTMKHTPGPWTHRNGRIFQTDRPELTIANVARAFDGDYSPANGGVLAAAADMLAALIVAREFISADRNTLADCAIDFDGRMSDDDAAAVADYDKALLQIDAAIQKATTRSAT